MTTNCKLLLLTALLSASAVHAETIKISEMEGIENITCYNDNGKTAARANLSTIGNALTIEGVVYDNGIGTHAPSVMIVQLNGATSFSGIIGVDDEADQKTNHGVVDYVITAYGESVDDTTELASGNLNRQSDSWHVDISLSDLSGYQYVMFDFQTGTQAWADHVDVVNAEFTYSGDAPVFVAESSMYVTEGGDGEDGEDEDDSVVNLPETATLEGAQILPLSSLQVSNIASGWGTTKANLSIDGNPLTMKGKTYTSGIGLHASAKVVIKLNGSAPKFHCEIGNDDEVAPYCTNNTTFSAIDYQVILRDLAGRQTVVMSGAIHSTDAETVTVDLDGLSDYKYLIIDFDMGTNDSYDHVDIGNAYFEFLYQNSNEPEIVPESAIAATMDCATTVFSQPGVKFMQKFYSLNSDLVFSVEGLPEGLTLNEERALIEGIVETEGVYTYTVIGEYDGDQIAEDVTLTVSSSLQMPTPFMGWLSWNVVQGEISYDVVTAVADNIEKYGLAAAGYNCVMCDDLWHASARESGTDKPLANSTRFPGGTLKPAADYVHAKGLKFGNYSDVAASTCAGAFGSYGYEAIDAETYAEWGIDMVKVDYCGAPQAQTEAYARYKAFGDELSKYGITQFVCEWGVREPWKWAAEVGSPVWRATYDARDCWNGKTGGIGILQSINGMKDLWMYNGVNRWNDADMVCIGIHGTGKSSSDLCATGPGMTMDEYGTQMALWCMWQSPIALTCDLRKDLGTGSTDLTQEDIDLLCNPDLLALDQDRMGQAGVPIHHDDDFFVMAKDCENGDVALSVTNLSDATKSYTFTLADVPGLNGTETYTVRNCMTNQNCENASQTLEAADIPSHATAVYRLSAAVETGIDAAAAAEALGAMTVSVDGDAVNVCLPGTDGVSKRLLVSDIDGRVIAQATGVDECFTFSAPKTRGVYFVNVVCAARSESVKLTL